MRKLMFAVAIAACGAAVAGDGDNELVEESSASAWHFRIGTVMSPRVRCKFRGTPIKYPKMPESGSWTYETDYAIPRHTIDPTDDEAYLAGREYVNGKVTPDNGTDDPDSMIFNQTWLWWADDIGDGAQYSSANGMVSFNTEMTYWTKDTVSSTYRGGANDCHDRDIQQGVEFVAGYTFYRKDDFLIDFDLGGRFYGTGDELSVERYGARTSTTIHGYRFVDSYSASGWTSTPGGQHIGTDPSRVIGDYFEPTREEREIPSDELRDRYGLESSSSYSYSSYNRTELDYEIWDIRMGPTFGWQPWDFFTLRAGFYGLIGLVHYEFNSDVVTSEQEIHSSNSKCVPIFGIASGLSAQFNITKNLFIMGSIEYDWWTKDVNLWAGQASGKLELSDFSVALSVGVEF